MKTYYFEYEGVWPVGACGIVTAKTKKTAFDLAQIMILSSNGNPYSIVLDDLIEYDTMSEHCTIIIDGDY